MTVVARLTGAFLGARPLMLAGVLLVLAWPIANTPARATLDGSWQIALHMAASTGLRHGMEIVFTHGPLGFLGFSHPNVGGTSALALFAAMAVYLGLVGTMLVGAARILPLWAAAIVTLLAARIFSSLPPFEAFQALFFLWCVEALADRIPMGRTKLAVIAGVLAGIVLLGKVNVGIIVFALGAATSAYIGRPWWRAPAVYLAAAATTGIALWLATGQQLRDIGAYTNGVYQMISGYNEAMGGDPQPKRLWVYLALAASAAILIWAGSWTSREWPWRRRIGLAVLGLLFGFAMWKTAVVREHTIFVFATSVVAMFSFAHRIDQRTWLVALLGLGIAFAGSSAVQPRAYLDVVGSTRSLYSEVRNAFLPGRAAQAAERTRASLRSQHLLEPSTFAVLRGHTVHVDPHLTSVMFAYPELRWLPLPIFQSYAAYTSELDRLNANLLRSDAAPQRILRSVRPAGESDTLRLWMGRPIRAGEIVPFTVDGRFRWFESPDTTLETFCRYVEMTASSRWQVLARTDGSCGPPEALGTVSSRAGETVSVPAETRADRFVIVRILGLEPSIVGRLRAALFKGPDWYVTLDDTRYRLVPGTAGDGLLLAVPPTADGSGPFAFGAPISTIRVTQGLDDDEPGVPLTYEFLSVPLP